MISNEHLIERVHSLPQELQDIVHAFTFNSTATPCASQRIVRVDRNDRNPSMLQVNGASRRVQAWHKYAKSIFHVPDEDVLNKWYRALEPVATRSYDGTDYASLILVILARAQSDIAIRSRPRESSTPMLD